jgi:hypothetical protein
MMRPTSRPSYLIQSALIVAATAALALAPQAALAQHGGGGHGGGGGHFGGGGGGYLGGGSSSGSHASSSSSGTHGNGSPSGTRPSNSSHASPSIVSYGASPSSSARPAGPTPGFAATTGHGASTIPQHMTIGFPDSEHASAGSNLAAWQSFAPTQGGGVLSFSGQGHEIWQDSPRGAGPDSSEFLESRPTEEGRARPFPPRIFHGGFYGPGYGYGYGFGGFYPWGFGLGFGFGLGCDPFWDFGCNAYGYPGSWNGYDGAYGPGLYFGSSSDNGGGPSSDTSQDYGVYSGESSQGSNWAGTSSNGTVMLYLNDGTSFAVTDYWVADYKLHYVTEGARENVIDLDQIDVQRTVDENAARGVGFTLRPTPGSAQGNSAAPPATTPAPSPSPDSTATPQ